MKVFVILPTYNEKENISALLKKLIETSGKVKGYNMHIVIVDDNSPDGTGKIAENFGNKKVTAIIRKGKRGRGLAGIEGYNEAIRQNADYVIEMDADFSHDPTYIKQMLSVIKKQKADVVLGSRLVKGSNDERKNTFRKFVTKASNFYVRTILGMKIRDCNSGYRCFRTEVLKDIIKELKAEGPDIVQEVTYKAYRKGYKIIEIPIMFKDRQKGKSKLGFRQLVKGLLIVLKLRFS